MSEWETIAPQRRSSDGWETLPGGAAVGNPQMQAQSKNLKPFSLGENTMAIGGAGGIGATFGAFAPEILKGAANVTRAVPLPITQAASRGLDFLSSATRNAGRATTAISGFISGATGETAKIATDNTDFGKEYPAAGHVADAVAGGIAGEGATLTKAFLKRYALTPALSVWTKIMKEGIRESLEKIDGPVNISKAQNDWVISEMKRLRAGTGGGDGSKSFDELENIGSIMSKEGQSLLDAADKKMIAAIRQSDEVGDVGPFQREMADVGERLQKRILSNNQEALASRSSTFKSNEISRNRIVSFKEGRGEFISKTSEYNSLMSELRERLNNSSIKKEASSVQSGYQKLINELENAEKDVFGQSKPTSFDAVDQVRRKLGEAFKGKPPEGYDAIGKSASRDLYHKISNIQKQFAGGEGGPQAKLLADYASDTPGLQIFTSKLGKKVTALDQFREGQFPDPSDIPKNFFKTRASVIALKEMTGSSAMVNSAAVDYANKELSGKTGPQVRAWVTKNSDWLSQLTPAANVISRYATKLEAAERSVESAADFVKTAMKDSSKLIGKGVPAQKAIDLIKSGDVNMWNLVAPIIARSPKAKSDMVIGVRQVIAEHAKSESTIDLFQVNIRPFLEKANIASKSEMDFIAKSLDDIQNLNIPPGDKLKQGRRLLLNATSSWVASAAAEGGVSGYRYMSNQVPDGQPNLQPQ